MKIRIDVKSLVAGLILGALVFLAMGQAMSGAGKSDFGFSIDYRGYAVVRDNAGIAYVIDPQTTRAKIIEYADGPYKGRALDLNRVMQVEQKK
jgi:hypothetical protein